MIERVRSRTAIVLLPILLLLGDASGPATANPTPQVREEAADDPDDSAGPIDIRAIHIEESSATRAARSLQRIVVSTYDSLDPSSFDQSFVDIAISVDSDAVVERHIVIQRTGADRLITTVGNRHNDWIGYGQTFYTEGDSAFTIQFPLAILGRRIGSYRFSIQVSPAGATCSDCFDRAPDEGKINHRSSY